MGAPSWLCRLGLVRSRCCGSTTEMTKDSPVDARIVATVGLLVLCICAASSCDSHTCGGQRTLVDKYVGFDANDNSLRVSRCFGPTSDCAPICEDLAIALATDSSNNGKTAMMGSVVLCERVPSPDGWADGGFKGWEDAGYVEQLSYDGGTVDPNRIIHLIAGVSHFW